MGFQAEKKLILDYYQKIQTTPSPDMTDILMPYVSGDWHWRGYYPFYEQKGAAAVAGAFWQPLMASFTSIQRRQDVFFAGVNEIDATDAVWVVSLGHLAGLFDAPFFGIPATRKMSFLRYCEFNRIENGKIAETAFYFDLPHLMEQAGLSPFKNQRGAQLVQPGPITHDGLCFHDCHPDEGKKTLAVINAMIDDLGQWNLGIPLEEELARTWHEDMIWWGPTGIGASYTIARYAEQHAAPFRAAFSHRSATNHLCRLAEGYYGGFFGWPNFTATLHQEYLGIPSSDIVGEFRVIDIYRRKGDKLAENWVFIDLPHWLKQHGVEILPDPAY